MTLRLSQLGAIRNMPGKNLPALDDLAKRINAKYEACQTAMDSAVEHAVRAGDLLIEAKAGLLNGGALVVTVAFLGSTTSNDFDHSSVLTAIAIWSIGLLFSAGSLRVGYLSQLSFDSSSGISLSQLVANDEGSPDLVQQLKAEQEAERKKGQSLQKWSAYLAGGSLLAFMLGTFWAIVAFLESGSG